MEENNDNSLMKNEKGSTWQRVRDRVIAFFSKNRVTSFLKEGNKEEVV